MTKKSEHTAEIRARIIRLLNCEPMGDTELAPYMGMHRNAVAYHTKRMHKERLIHVCGYREETLIGLPAGLWGIGDKPDFVRILKNTRQRVGPDVTEQRKSDILKLVSEPATAKEIAGKIGLSSSRVLKYLLWLRKAGKVRVAGWKRDTTGKHWVSQYGLGNEPDAPLPDPAPTSSRSRCGSQALGDDKAAMLRSRATIEQTIAAARAKPCGFWHALGI